MLLSLGKAADAKEQLRGDWHGITLEVDGRERKVLAMKNLERYPGWQFLPLSQDVFYYNIPPQSFFDCCHEMLSEWLQTAPSSGCIAYQSCQHEGHTEVQYEGSM